MRPPLLLLAVLVAAPATTWADTREWRWSAALSSGLVAVEEQGHEDTTLGIGGRARAAYGLSNAFDLGVSLDAERSLLFEHDGVSRGDDEGTLYQRRDAMELAFDARLLGGRWLAAALYRWHPILGARVGLSTARTHDRELFSDGVRILTLENDWTLRPVVAGEVGVEFRTRNSWTLGVLGSITRVDATTRVIGLTVEVSLLQY